MMLNIQILHSFIIHIDFLLLDFEWYSKVYHGMFVSEYMRHRGRHTTLITSQGSDTVTSIFKCNNPNTIKSLRLLKMA